jgi:hypothetical protein
VCVCVCVRARERERKDENEQTADGERGMRESGETGRTWIPARHGATGSIIMYQCLFW